MSGHNIRWNVQHNCEVSTIHFSHWGWLTCFRERRVVYYVHVCWHGWGRTEFVKVMDFCIFYDVPLNATWTVIIHSLLSAVETVNFRYAHNSPIWIISLKVCPLSRRVLPSTRDQVATTDHLQLTKMSNLVHINQWEIKLDGPACGMQVIEINMWNQPLKY